MSFLKSHIGGRSGIVQALVEKHASLAAAERNRFGADL
jgi:hypothetical protein